MQAKHWWHESLITALVSQRQSDLCEFQNNPTQINCLEKSKKIKKKKITKSQRWIHQERTGTDGLQRIDEMFFER